MFFISYRKKLFRLYSGNAKNIIRFSQMGQFAVVNHNQITMVNSVKGPQQQLLIL